MLNGGAQKASQMVNWLKEGGGRVGHEVGPKSAPRLVGGKSYLRTRPCALPIPAIIKGSKGVLVPGRDLCSRCRQICTKTIELCYIGVFDLTEILATWR